MERLPNELWLFVFSYLENADILYSFFKLNTRFEHLITSFMYDIDLSNVSYRSCKYLLENIIPRYEHQIRSLTLKNRFQLKLFNEFLDVEVPNTYLSYDLHLKRNIHTDEEHDKISIYQYPKYLQCLTLMADHYRVLTEKNYKTIEIGLSMNFHFDKLYGRFSECLTDLRIFANFYLGQTIEQIALNSQLSQTLTHLTLVSTGNNNYLYYKSYDRSSTNRKIHMPNVRTLTIHVNSWSNLHDLFLIFINLNELNLSIAEIPDSLDPHGWKSLLDKLKIPKSLIKLHFESAVLQKFGPNFHYKYEQITNFVLLLKEQLQSLTLIVFDSCDQAFTIFNQFKENFPYLHLFEYFIHTNQYPIDYNQSIERFSDHTYYIYNTKSRPISFMIDYRQQATSDKKFSSRYLYNLTSLDYYYGQISNDIQLTSRLHYLVEIRYYYDSNIFQLDKIEISLLRRILSLTPNLNILDIKGDTPQQLIDLLQLLPIGSLKKLRTLKLSSEEILLHVTFLIGLAQIISSYRNIKHLGLYGTRNHKTTQFLTPMTLLDHMKNYFPNIIHFDLSICLENEKEKQIYQRLKQWLKQCHNQLLIITEDLYDEAKFSLWI